VRFRHPDARHRRQCDVLSGVIGATIARATIRSKLPRSRLTARSRRCGVAGLRQCLDIPMAIEEIIAAL